MRRQDFVRVTEWLGEVLPGAIRTPRLRERLEAYAVMHDLRQCIQFPERPGDLAWRPAQRLRAIVEGRSYLGYLLPR